MSVIFPVPFDAANPHQSANQLSDAMEAVARELLGEPSHVDTRKRELRWGTNGSLCVSLDKGTWHDHERSKGGGVLDLVRDRKSLDKSAALEWLRDRGHLPPRDSGKFRIVAHYPYTDADGVVLFEVVRLQPKAFRQRRLDEAGQWVWNMDGVPRVLYRLPKLIAAVAAGQHIYIAEGEKAADALAGLNVTATCSPGGANKWRREYGAHLAGARVVVLPDNDEPGRQHAQAVAAALRGIAASVTVVELPGLPPKGDASDWVEAGGTAAQFHKLADAAPDASVSLAGAPDDGAIHQDNFELTEHGVALAFANRHMDALRYCHHSGAWFEWTGTHWKRNETKRAFSWARRLVAELNRGAEFKTKAITGKAAFAAAVERFAQADDAFAVTSEMWDTDPWLLGTPGGVVDLRTAELRSAQQADYITKQAAVGPAASSACPLWLGFLEQATGGDAGLVRFLRQWCGYCLTGNTREHALLFGFGPGGNGKSVFLNTVARVMGGYARNAAMETFTASASDRHPTDLAMLRGARLVTASETEEGRAWAEVRVKQLTGGDPITARFMRQDFFEYQPQFKLTIVGNHKPALKAVDEAMRRRFNIVPFLHKPTEPDKDLEAKLQAEWPSILRWMIEGCMDWQLHGLVRPMVVTDATKDYFEAQDHFSRWLSECCDLLPTASTKPSHLLHSFTHWCQTNGEMDADNRKLRGLIERTPGLRYVTTKGIQWVRGISIKPPPDDQ